MSNLRNCSAFVLKQSLSIILNPMGTIQTNSGLNSSVRTFSRTKHRAKSKNFYEDLEIQKTATQSEIKTAYYELSMAYHPDKNKTEEGKLKFRKITEAYEVLGNVRTRRMYDKGIGSFGGQSTATSSSGTESEIIYEETEDDAQTKFYKQHMVKSKAPTMAGRTTAREFDDYAAAITTKSFHQLQRARNAQREKIDDIRSHEETNTAYLFIMTIALFMIIFMLISRTVHDRAHDAEIRRLKLLHEKKASEK